MISQNEIARKSGLSNAQMSRIASRHPEIPRTSEGNRILYTEEDALTLARIATRNADFNWPVPLTPEDQARQAMEREVEQLRHENAQLRQQVEASAEAHRRQVDALNAQLREQVGDLTAQLATSAADADHAVAQHRQEVDDLRQQVEVLRHELATARTDAEAKGDQITALTEELATVRAELSAAVQHDRDTSDKLAETSDKLAAFAAAMVSQQQARLEQDNRKKGFFSRLFGR